MMGGGAFSSWTQAAQCLGPTLDLSLAESQRHGLGDLTWTTSVCLVISERLASASSRTDVGAGGTFEEWKTGELTLSHDSGLGWSIIWFKQEQEVGEEQ